MSYEITEERRECHSCEHGWYKDDMVQSLPIKVCTSSMSPNYGKACMVIGGCLFKNVKGECWKCRLTKDHLIRMGTATIEDEEMPVYICVDCENEFLGKWTDSLRNIIFYGEDEIPNERVQDKSGSNPEN